MCGFLDRFKRKLGKRKAEEPVMPEIVEDDENTVTRMREEIGYDGSLAYESGKGMIFHLKITNRTDTPWGNLKVGIASSRTEILFPVEKILRCEMLDPKRSEMFKFYLEPSLKAGTADISIYITYFDFNRKESIEVTLPGATTRMVLPKLSGEHIKMTEIFDTDWRMIVSSMEYYELESDVIEKKSSIVFLDIKEAIQSLGIHAFKPEVNPNIYRAVCRFWAKDTAGKKFGIHLEIIGKDEKTKALLIFYASDHMELLPFAAGVVSHIRKSTEYKRNL